MVQFVAKNLPVDNSDLSELDGYKPFSPAALSIGRVTRYKDGVMSVKVTEDDALKYRIAKIEVSRKEANKLFKGDDWESDLFRGADGIKGSTQDDALFGFNGNDIIDGRGGGDEISGGRGKDILNGGAGVNTLAGDAGKDTFVFGAALAAGNYSDITDFESGKDIIQLDRGAFSGIGAQGTLGKAKFFVADDYAGKANSIIHDEATGTLYYAKAGGGTVADAQSFGRVALGVELGNTDFLIA